ncbi:MAG: GntR family transcriptional regulator [Acidimicrobiia bacterium]|jgi:DNA-binding GntR family transcriptional regulator
MNASINDDRIEQVSLSQQVATKLRSEILSGAIEPGAPIVVRDLVERLGVSHIPIREALRELEAESLVIPRPGQSVITSGVDIDELHDLYRLRRLLEVDALRRAFPHYSREFLDDARKIYDELLGSPPREGNSKWWGVHRRYHWCFLEPGLTPWSTKLLRLVWQTSERYQRLYILVFGSVQEANVEHDSVLTVASRGDVDAFIDAWLHHLDRTKETIVSGYLALHGNGAEDE